MEMTLEELDIIGDALMAYREWENLSIDREEIVWTLTGKIRKAFRLKAEAEAEAERRTAK